MKTNEQIEKEIKALKAVRPNVRPESMFGDDNLGALDAQIDVLENYLDEDEIFDKYDPADFPMYILNSARQACEWMNDGEDPDDGDLSEGWPLKKQQP